MMAETKEPAQEPYPGGARRAAADPLYTDDSSFKPTVIRDFIPSADELTDAERQRFIFGRDPGTITPDFVPTAPPEKSNVFPIGDSGAQMAEAARTVKERNAADAGADDLDERINTIRHKNFGDAIEFIENLNDVDRERYLEAEEKGPKRKTVLASFGR